MRIYLGGYLNFYHPDRTKHWLEVDIKQPDLLVNVLEKFKIPTTEIHLAVYKGEAVDFRTLEVNNEDEIKLYSAVGGG
jgi:hypothetical protein